jgi:pimeloyl-ACP methyl ester carboxylesterase
MDLFYKEYGNKEGPLLLFIHGGGVGGWMWDKQVDYFSDYHCIVPDLPEQGQRHFLHPFSIPDSAQKLIELLEQKGKGKRLIVVGFSLGAQIVIQMLSMKHDLIDYAIINSASVRPIPFAKSFIKPLIRMTFPLVKNKSFSKVQAKALYINNEQFETYYEQSASMKSDSLIRVLEESLSYTLPTGFAKANSKILVTAGSKEKGTMLKSARKIVQSNPNCTGIVLEGGHGVMLANPAMYNKLVDGWLSSGAIPEQLQRIR